MKSQFNTTVVIIDADELVTFLHRALNHWLLSVRQDQIKTFNRKEWLRWSIYEALERYYYLYSQDHYRDDQNQKIFQAVDQFCPRGIGNVFYTYLPPTLIPCVDRVEQIRLTPGALAMWVKNTESL